MLPNGEPCAEASQIDAPSQCIAPCGDNVGIAKVASIVERRTVMTS